MSKETPRKIDQLYSADVTRFKSLHGRHPVLIHCCNNRRKMGAGVAKAIVRAYPEARAAYENMSMELGAISTVTLISNKTICHIVGQDDYGRDKRVYVKYDALLKGMNTLVEWFSENTEDRKAIPIEIHCPRLGCDLAGGNWKMVKALLTKAFIERDIPVTVYNLNRKKEK